MDLDHRSAQALDSRLLDRHRADAITSLFAPVLLLASDANVDRQGAAADEG